MDCKVTMLVPVFYGLLVVGFLLYATQSGYHGSVYYNLATDGEASLSYSLEDEIFSVDLTTKFDDKNVPKLQEQLDFEDADGFGNSSAEHSLLAEENKQVIAQKKEPDNSSLDQLEQGGHATESAEMITGNRNAQKVAEVQPLINISEVSPNSDFSTPRDDSLETKVEGDPANRNFTRDIKSFSFSKRPTPTSIAQMNSLLLQNMVVSSSRKRRLSSAQDRELLSAKLRIMNGPEVKNSKGLSAAIFRNISTFLRSYELMERTLKIFVYKEGNKPIFHQPITRGLYASEGWFLKLLEGNKMFTVRDPKKAHLFFLPFSSLRLRIAMEEEKTDVEALLKSYVGLLSRKYRFWNRTNGTDHFLVGCHDRAYKFTMQHPIANCIRVLCNANVAKGFKIGKDSSLPVTYIRSASNPQRDVGGKPAMERPILAFFAGSMHGYLRPILLQHWENRESDMKIFGPMRRDPEGKSVYREYMKSSKYCICARGYEVHTPRVVESIWYECVPVIIADNYVPPFFEVLNWESFAVFVREEDIPNLRSILLAIPEKRYLEMQQRVKMVQHHFLWQRPTLKYDLFHMILHSVWHNRLLHI